MNISINLKINTFPCIANKCIVYPVCKHKKIINCDEIKDHFRQVTINKGNRQQTYDVLSEVLPCANKVFLHAIDSKGRRRQRFRLIRIKYE